MGFSVGTDGTRQSVTMRVDSDAVWLAGERIFSGPPEELLERLAELIATRDRHLVVTPNVDHVVSMRHGRGVAAFHASSLRVLDGMPLVALAKLMGARNAHRNTGSDLLPLVVEQARLRRWRVAITGGRTGVAELAVARLGAEHPETTLIALPFPMIASPDDVSSQEVVNALEALRPDIVFLCLGSPKQEDWYLRWREELPPAVYIGAGASVDFAAGIVARAPASAQRLGLEWLWRLAQEPRRLARRYLIDGAAFLLVVAASLRPRRASLRPREERRA